MRDVRGVVDAEADDEDEVGGRDDVDLGGDSIEKFQLETWLEKSPELWLETPYTKKKSKKLYFRHVLESKWNLKPFFQAETRCKIFSIE